MYYTYVLQSEVDGQFYTGYTQDLKLRFDQQKKDKLNLLEEDVRWSSSIMKPV